MSAWEKVRTEYRDGFSAEWNAPPVKVRLYDAESVDAARAEDAERLKQAERDFEELAEYRMALALIAALGHGPDRRCEHPNLCASCIAWASLNYHGRRPASSEREAGAAVCDGPRESVLVSHGWVIQEADSETGPWFDVPAGVKCTRRYCRAVPG